MEVSAASTEPPACEMWLLEISLEEDERVFESFPMEDKTVAAGKVSLGVRIVPLGDIFVPGDLPAEVPGELLMLADGDR